MNTGYSLRRAGSAPQAALAAALALVVAVLAAPGVRAQEPAGGADEKPVLQSRVDGHRPLRANPHAEAAPAGPAAPPAAFTGYPEAPAFSVVPRRDKLTFYPCETCHAAMPVNTQRRQLYSPHPAALEHGNGRIWCLDCHAGEGRNHLQTLAGDEVDFNDAYLVCGQCHYQPQRDWYFGAHGKRVGNWQGERELYNCTHCHDPHAPAVRPRAPEPPPPVRAGLQPMTPGPAHHNGSTASTDEEAPNELETGH
jgi:hypothetical protein